MILAPTITPIIAAQLAGPEENFTYAYAVIALIYGLIMMACYLVVGIFVKETVKDPAGPVQRTPLKETLSALFKNTHFLLILATTFLYVVSVVLSSSVVLYFILYRMNAPELQSVLLFVSTLPTVASIFIVKPMIKKWGKRVTGMIGVSMGILGTVVRFLFIDGVLGMYIAGSCLAGLGMGLFSALLIPLLLDTVEYGEWKFGIRNEGMIVAANSFGYKLAMGVGPAVVGFALQASGYIAGAATQNQSTLNMLTVLSIAAPIVCYIAIVILLKFSKTEGMMPTIYKELALKRAAAGSAQAIKAD
jgi:GPH family glycoside/pentoside/hexuronide:cation symporter